MSATSPPLPASPVQLLEAASLRLWHEAQRRVLSHAEREAAFHVQRALECLRVNAPRVSSEGPDQNAS